MRRSSLVAGTRTGKTSYKCAEAVHYLRPEHFRAAYSGGYKAPRVRVDL